MIMPRLSGAQSVINALQQGGVHYVFGIPGGVILPLYDALYEEYEERGRDGGYLGVPRPAPGHEAYGEESQREDQYERYEHVLGHVPVVDLFPPSGGG